MDSSSPLVIHSDIWNYPLPQNLTVFWVPRVFLCFYFIFFSYIEVKNKYTWYSKRIDPFLSYVIFRHFLSPNPLKLTWLIDALLDIYIYFYTFLYTYIRVYNYFNYIALFSTLNQTYHVSFQNSQKLFNPVIHSIRRRKLISNEINHSLTYSGFPRKLSFISFSALFPL